MGTGRGALTAGVALALGLAPAASAAGTVSVGYTSPAALRGVRVLERIAPLHVAEVPAAGAALLRGRAGIRFVRPTVPRVHLGDAHAAAPASVLAAEWEFVATHENLVPASALRAAASVTIAVVDTGADLAAPAIAAKSPITWNAVTDTPAVSDVTGHGTFVASVAAGSAAGGDGLHGFGGDAKLMIVQANRDADTFDDVDEAAGIVWAVDHGAKIVNLSIGGADTSQVEQNAVRYAVAHGVLVVAAAGNTGQSGNVVSYPGALAAAHGLAVAATTSDGRRAPFSTVASYVSIAAPGVQVLGATTPTSPRVEFPRASVGAPGLYAYGSGTSYAAPQVAGAAALVWGADPRLTAAGVVRVLEQTASGHGRRNDDTGYGVLDAAAAVARAAALAAAAPPMRQPVAATPTVLTG